MVDQPLPVELIGHHGSTDAPTLRKIDYPRRCMIDSGPVNVPQLGELIGGEEESSSDIVAKLFDSRRRISPAYARRSQPNVAQFVEQRESPGSLCVLIVDDDERGNVIGERDASEHLHVDICVVAAEIADEQPKDAGLFRLLSQIAKAVRPTIGYLPASTLSNVELKRLPYGLQN